MGKKLKKMVMRRQGLCDFVVGATKMQGPGIGGSLKEYLSTALGAEEAPPNLEQPIVLLGRKLRHYGDAMVDADQEYFAALSDLAETQAGGEVLSSQLKGKVLSLRSTCLGMFGTETVQALALDFNVVPNRDVAGMLRLGDIVQDRLRNSEIELVPKRWWSEPLDLTAVAAEFDVDLVPLRETVARIFELRKQVDTAKVRKDETRQEFDRQYVRIARVLESFFRLVGEDELADRIRPSVRQLVREGGDDEEPAAEEGSETSETESVVVAEIANTETPETVVA